jgi:hypothetical protein
VKTTIAIAALCLGIYFVPEWNWLLYLVWWAVTLSAGAALTTAFGFSVLRWPKHKFPEREPPARPLHSAHPRYRVRSGQRATVHRPMPCTHPRIGQFSNISAMTVWTKDARGGYEPDERITKALDEQTEWWECGDCEQVDPDIAP